MIHPQHTNCHATSCFPRLKSISIKEKDRGIDGKEKAKAAAPVINHSWKVH
jgi:hypothetical protein